MRASEGEAIEELQVPSAGFARRNATYDEIGVDYACWRRADARIAALIEEALGDAVRVLNVGAGAGAYEPSDRQVVALDPSVTMLSQRASGTHPAVAGAAEHLPFPDDAFDAVMVVLSVHHWADRKAGYAELRRVARRRVVLTYEPVVHNSMWMIADYVPAIAELDDARPGFCIAEVAGGIEATTVTTVPVPADCSDGFVMAYWRRPEALLDPAARMATSGFSLADPAEVARGMGRLQADLSSGAWDDRYGALRRHQEWDAGLRLVVASP